MTTATPTAEQVADAFRAANPNILPATVAKLAPGLHARLADMVPGLRSKGVSEATLAEVVALHLSDPQGASGFDPNGRVRFNAKYAPLFARCKAEYTA